MRPIEGKTSESQVNNRTGLKNPREEEKVETERQKNSKSRRKVIKVDEAFPLNADNEISCSA